MDNETSVDLIDPTLEYYDSNANIINSKYSHGYQIALIKNSNYSRYGLKKQNYYYLTELIDLKKDQFVVDIGCGNGQFLDFLKDHDEYKYCNYVGVDLSENQITNAKNTFSGIPGSFMSIDMHEFFFSEKYNDVCYFLESIGYSTDLNTLVKSISTGLKIGGKIVIKNPVKIVEDEEKDKLYQESFAPIQKEYGYADNSLGMLPDKKVIEDVFLANGFELEKFEIPECDIMTYNNIFLKNKKFVESHPEYVKHITQKVPQDYSPNQYLECAIFVFNKIEDVVKDRNELSYVQQRYEQYTGSEPMDEVIKKSIDEMGDQLMDPTTLEMYHAYPEAAKSVIKTADVIAKEISLDTLEKPLTMEDAYRIVHDKDINLKPDTTNEV